jgi:non-ribosomal peptide synthetase-like protein
MPPPLANSSTGATPSEPCPGQEPRLLHEFFEEAAARWPDNPAIDVPPASNRRERSVVTYAQLKLQSDALADYLSGFVAEECVIAILLPRNSTHLYAAQLAVLKAGAAYTCIDPTFPDDQVNDIFEDARPVAILTDADGLKRAERLTPDAECVLDAIEWIDRLPTQVAVPEPAPWLTPSTLAYIIYTSGTTGRPKGVMIEHGAIANLVRGNIRELGVLPRDRVGQSSSSAYDASVEEIWFALGTGATLVVMDDETTRLGPDLVPWLRRERLTLFGPPPTMLRATGCEHPEQELPELRLLHVGGEALPEDVAERWARGRCLVNDYGPTECTVTSLRGEIGPGEPITIGQPIPGTRAWVLDDALEEVADGVRGELCIGGACLARGYMHSPDLTAQKFPVHPKLGRIYRTGDLVHRDAAGNFFCHGRIDAQVKIRGYRIELEAIEARLTECAGVREAACRVQGDDAQQKIAAFVVPEDSGAPPSFDYLKNALRQRLPEYMVPSRFGLLDALPRSVSGKLSRGELPILDAPVHQASTQVLPPRNAIEEKLATAFQKSLRLSEAISITDDFFNDLGGDSLLAAQTISRLRDDPATASLTVRDLYDARTAARLATRVRAEVKPTVNDADRPQGRPVLATLVQTLWLIVGLIVGAPIAYLAAFELPNLAEALGMVPFLLLLPVFYFVGVFAYTSLTAAFAVLVKELLIGRYRPVREPIWGSFYVRNWMVQQSVRLVPWRLLEGTVFQQAVLRALGARIGQRVHIHRGVNLLQGGWDLLDIGDDVTLGQESAVQLVEFEEGQILIGPVTLGNGATLEVRAGVAGHSCVEADGYLTALSYLQRGDRIPGGERWEGVPAKRAGAAPLPPPIPEGARDLSPRTYAAALFLARVALGVFVALPAEGLALVFVLIFGVDAENASAWLDKPVMDLSEFLLAAALVLLAVPLTLLFEVIAIRAMGRVPHGVIGRWSLPYIRVWLKAGLVQSANQWLSGTLLWPRWLRLAGMKIGGGCEISSILDTIPELVEIGSNSFLADGIYLAGPKVHRGTVTLAPARIGQNTYFGNHVVIAVGQTVPDNVLLGVCTVADDRKLRSATAWFGHPPFELPKREIVTLGAGYNRVPMWLRFVNRVFWELLRFTLPLVPFLLTLAWIELLARADELPVPVLLLAVIPALEFGVLAALCVFGLLLKWALLGRVKPSVHALWSCWCSRWEFHYIAWDLYVAGPLSLLEGTLLLNAFLRAMGMRIGRRVHLGTGFAATIDHDMMEFQDGATVTCQFQAHTFEDRVLKIDHVTIRKEASVGNAAVLLYGADIGARTIVTPHSVVMKHERLLPHRHYAGCPTHLIS